MLKQENKTNSKSRMQWYLDAKFGLFIHWGAYTVAGAEASWPIMAPRLSEAMFGTPSTVSEEDYVKLASQFNPQDFDADEWVKIAQNAGMKYIIFTSKHHDGFCMFDAPGTDYKITNTEFGRDVCMELAQACKKADMRLGFYYSPPDMQHPGYRDTSKPVTKNWLGEPDRKEWAGYLNYMESHIRKLLTDYGDVSVIWFDGLCNHAKYDPQRFHKLIHELSPVTLINDRLGDDYDFVTPEQFIPSDGIPVKSGKPPSGDGIESEKFFRTVLTLFKIPVLKGWIRKQMHKYAEGTLDLSPLDYTNYPSPTIYQPWETCMTIGQTWAYNPNETKWKTSGMLVHNLSTVVGHGGNYLLNVGPTDLGVFPSEARECLEYIGKWMDTNSKAIYNTSFAPFSSNEWGTATHAGDMIYLHVHKWPEYKKLIVENFNNKAVRVSLSESNELDYTQDNEKLEILIPEKAPDKDVTIIAVQIDNSKPVLSEYTVPKPKGKSLKKYIQSTAIGSSLINGVANGLIALFSYRLESLIPSIDAGVDILITVAIITFLTSWLVTSGTRKDIDKEKVALPQGINAKTRKPMNSALKALIITTVCTLIFGGILFGLVLLIFPNGFSNWGYIIFKTLYTAATGALAVVVTIKSVVKERNRKEVRKIITD